MTKEPKREQLILSGEQVRALDRIAEERFGMTVLTLMENAGLRASEAVLAELKRVKGQRVCVLAGPGNNGGDGFVAARHLANAGKGVVVLLCEARDKYKGAALANLHIADKMGLKLLEVSEMSLDETAAAVYEQVCLAEVVVDALLGTGAKGKIREPLRTVIETLNGCDMALKTVALDVPSGLDADTGRPTDVAVKAARTVTFAAMKKGFLSLEAATYTGKVEVAGIGIDARLLAIYLDEA